MEVRKFKDLFYFEIKLTRMTWNRYHNICNLTNLHNHSLIRLHENNPFLVFLLCSKTLLCLILFSGFSIYFPLHEWWQESEAFKLQTTVQMHLFFQVQMQACCQNEKVISASLHTKKLDYSEYSNPNRILENNVLSS